MQLALSDIESGQDSPILVRERTRHTKLGPAFAKKQGKILSSTPHTISFLPAGRKSAQVLSKRDVAVQRHGNIHPIGDLVHPGTCCAHRAAQREGEHGRDQPTCSTSAPTNDAPKDESDESVIYLKTVAESPKRPTKQPPTQPHRDSSTQTDKGTNVNLQTLRNSANQPRRKRNAKKSIPASTPQQATKKLKARKHRQIAQKSSPFLKLLKSEIPTHTAPAEHSDDDECNQSTIPASATPDAHNIKQEEQPAPQFMLNS